MRSLYIFIINVIFVLRCFSQTTSDYALIIGLKKIDENKYLEKGKIYDADGILGADNDCKKIHDLLDDNGDYNIISLNDEQATAKKILDTLAFIGKQINTATKTPKVIFYFTGHGDTIPDKNHDEKSGYDQVLVAYDDFIVDDQINVLLKKYFLKSQNIMLIDACHSGSINNYVFLPLDFLKTPARVNSFVNESLVLKQNSQEGIDCDYSHPVFVPEPYNLIYFGATPDEQLAGGGGRGGAFTITLKNIIKDAKFEGNWKKFTYRTLACALQKKLMRENSQTLIYKEIGTQVSEYANQIPFQK